MINVVSIYIFAVIVVVFFIVVEVVSVNVSYLVVVEVVKYVVKGFVVDVILVLTPWACSTQGSDFVSLSDSGSE